MHKKVQAATVAAALTTIVVGVLHRCHIELTPAEQGAITTLIVAGAGWLKKA